MYPINTQAITPPPRNPSFTASAHRTQYLTDSYTHKDLNMLSVIWSKKKDSNILGLCKGLGLGDENQGLRILTKIANGNSKILVKPVFCLNQRTQENHSCFLLKSCHLCQKTLSLDKEVYMYR